MLAHLPGSGGLAGAHESERESALRHAAANPLACAQLLPSPVRTGCGSQWSRNERGRVCRREKVEARGRALQQRRARVCLVTANARRCLRLADNVRAADNVDENAA